MRERWIAKKRPDGRTELVTPDEMAAWMAKHWPEKSCKATLQVKKVERGRWVLRNGELVQVSGQVIRVNRQMQVIKDSEPFLNVAVDGKYIGGRKQRRDMMRAHGLEEIGNDPHGQVNRKQHDEFKPREFADDVKRAARQHGVDWL